jgi:hypothetical protein
MPDLPIRYAVLLALALPATPASAETLDQLDALADAASDEAGGITLAREQAGRGAYLEALSTLERVLGTFPTSRAALLDHATLLCMIDDRQGGRVELQLLRPRDYDAAALSEAQAFCADSYVAPSPPPPPAASTAKPKAN